MNSGVKTSRRTGDTGIRAKADLERFPVIRGATQDSLGRGWVQMEMSLPLGE